MSLMKAFLSALVLMSVATDWAGSCLRVASPLGATIANVQANATTVERYGKFEVTFDIVGTTATNPQFPYDPNAPPGIPAGVGITVDGLFSNDNWATTITQPGFLHQEYERNRYGGLEHLLPQGEPVWKVRFAPQQTGPWRYRIRANDASGTSYYPPTGDLSFIVVPSDSRGFLRVSEADPRYFEFSDGTPFIGVGHGASVDFQGRTYDAESQFAVYQANRANFFRIWMSGSSITGAAWAPWASHHLGSEGYLPPTSLSADQAYGGGDFSMKLWAGNPCMFQGYTAEIPVMPNTTYQIQARVKTVGVTGPATAGQPHGFVIKLGEWLGQACATAGQGQAISPYVTGSQEWQIVGGTITTGPQQHFLGDLYLSLVNSSGGAAYIDTVWVREVLAEGVLGPNLVRKPSMNYHLYFDQVASWQWDRILDEAARRDVSLKLVILEKDDWAYTHIDRSGNPISQGDTANFYAAPNVKVRWLHEAFWRYLIARWGYSTSVHSWELVNEGDPYSSAHYNAADALGQFMDERDPSRHMTTTSLWHSFPGAELWGNPEYSAIDYADLHAYVSTGWGLYELWGNEPATPLAFEDRAAYVRGGEGYSLQAPGSDLFHGATITPRGFTIRGQGEWVVRYWVKTEGWVGQCPYGASGSMAGPRLRWAVDDGVGGGNVIPAAPTGQDFVCSAPAGTHPWQQFSSSQTASGQAAPQNARIILTDDDLHTLHLAVNNSFGTGGWAWIDDISIVRPDGREMYLNGGVDLQRMDHDAALYTRAYSMIDGHWRSGIGKPLVRGEAGLDDYLGQAGELSELAADTDGLWLHNFVWGQINPGGMYDLYWYTDNIWNHNLHRHFKPFRDFMDGIPLNNGRYQDAEARSSNPGMRVWGQKDVVNGNVHLWVQNRDHTWRNVVDGVPIPALSGSVTIPGMPSGIYAVEWWNTYTGAVIGSEMVRAASELVLVLPVALSSDVGVKVSRLELPLAGSTKTVSPAGAAMPGDVLTYTVTLANSGSEPRSVMMTDTIPVHTDYIPGSASVVPQTGALSDVGFIRWTGMLSGQSEVQIRFLVRADPDLNDPYAISNTAVIASGEDLIERLAWVIIGARQVYLPIVLKQFS
ncbi:MAG: DUF11 domain-containing protein [Chloroflexi bacterium]|nr:DUF11 domain-containing protein [Chloroflexota bacterium]